MDMILVCPTCHPNPLPKRFVFMSGKVSALLSPLVSHGGADHSGIFSLFFFTLYSFSAVVENSEG